MKQLPKILPHSNLPGASHDITDQKNCENSLKQYEYIVSSSTDMMALLDKNFTYLIANNAYAKAFEKTPQQLIGNRADAIFDADFFNNVIKPNADLCFKGERINFKQWLEIPNNESIYLDVFYAPYYNKAQEIVGFSVNARDITKQYLAEIEIKNISNSWKTTFDAISDAIFLINLDHKIIQYNKATLNMFNLDPESIKDKHCHDLIQCDSFRSQNCPFECLKTSRLTETITFLQDNCWYKVSVNPIFDSDKNLIGGVHVVTDITTRKESELELLKSKERFKTLANTTSTAIFIYKGEKFIYSNKAAQNISGYTEAEFHNTKFWDFVHPDFREMVKERGLARLQQKDVFNNYEFKIICKDGTEKWLDFTAGVINWKDEIASIGTAIDITERKQAESKLRASERHFKHLFDANPQPMWIYDIENLQFLDVNETAIQKYGYTKEAFLSMTIKDIRPPEDVSLLLENIEKNKDPIQESGVWRHQLKDGTIIFVEINSHDFNFGKKSARLVIVNDITQKKLAEDNLKESEARLNLFFKQSLDGFFFMMFDKPIIWNDTIDKEKTLDYVFNNQHITKANQAVLDQYKATEDQFLNLTPNDLFKHNIKYGRQIWKEFLDKGKLHIDTKEKKFDGTDMIIEGDYVFLYDAENRITGHFAIQRDVTEERSNAAKILSHNRDLEAKIAERTAQLEYTNNELRDFAQVVSHDLKAPLRAISQLSYWLYKDYADKIDEVGQNQLNLIMSRTKRLDNLIEGILQYSKAGKSIEKEVEIDFNVLVNNCINALNPPKHIKITIDNTLPNYIADETRMMQLFQNLISNAISYNDKPKGAIHIGCKTKNGFYEFYVSDNGMGIEEQYFEQIFQIFQRLESRDVREGTGIGLSLVKRIVQIYGGEVKLTSKIGEGTIFFFTLPVLNKLN